MKKKRSRHENNLNRSEVIIFHRTHQTVNNRTNDHLRFIRTYMYDDHRDLKA